MRKAVSLFAVILAAVLAITLTGCGKTADTGQKEGTGEYKKLENPDVYILHWGEFVPETDDTDKLAVEWYEKNYGGKILSNFVQYAEYELKLLSMVSAGNAPELTMMNDLFMPKLAIRNLIQPVDDYIDTEAPIWETESMDYFKWKGKHYLLEQKGQNQVPKCYFNQTLFENNGVKTPLEYYDEGAWTFENFRKAAMELTQDTDKDGKTDQWGYSGWNWDVFIFNNGGSYVKFNDNGGIDITWNNSNFLEAIQFIEDGLFTDKFIDPAGTSNSGAFAGGKIGMVLEGDWFLSMFCTGMEDKIGIALTPVGPKGTPGTTFGWLNGFAMGNGCKNPEGAGIFATKWAELANDISEGRITPSITPKPFEGFTEDQVAYQKKLSRETKVLFSLVNGISNWPNDSWVSFWPDIMAGVPPATVIEKNIPILQRNIDAALADTAPKVEPFKAPAPEDFETGAMTILTVAGVTPVKAEVTKDAAEIIGGAASLKIEAANAGGFVIRTDETKLKLPSFHIYAITFDYKVIKAPSAGGSFVVLGMPKANMADWAQYYSWNQMPELKDGDTGTYTCNISIDKDSADNVILIYNTGGGIIVIDNLKIEETK